MTAPVGLPVQVASDLPVDYLERVYAGVLGKIIGVYLGRPFEGWSFERIMAELGEVEYYVHERLGVPLVVTDDDISGTFTFLRALEDYGFPKDISPEQIGQTWLNYLLEGRTILWWGGFGMSTEHTAYLRLKSGVPAPESGSIQQNGLRVAEQIGAQIFIDGWGMVAPGNPALAADLARRAASVSHDGEAIHAAQVIAVLVAQAFVEADIQALLETALEQIPGDSIIARVIADLRELRGRTDDWREARAFVATNYGYDKYQGVCHVVPNHALIVLALLYGDGDFQESLKIVNTCGWDTDCNSANVGCILGIRNGLAGLETGPDWRGPVADRLYLPSADGGRAISDAVTEAYQVVNAARALRDLERIAPKGGARFHFSLLGSVQGFTAEDSPEVRGTLRLENVPGHSGEGTRSLALEFQGLAAGRVARTSTPTFSPPEALALNGTTPYDMIASPTIYPGQQLHARLSSDALNPGPVRARLYLRHYDGTDALVQRYGPEAALAPGMDHRFEWRIPDLGGQPIAEIGLELTSLDGRRSDGLVYLDFLTWDGTPEVVLARPSAGGTRWRQAWVNGVDALETRWPEAYRLIQNHGRGLISQGTREWTDYRASATITPHLSSASGLGVRVQGMRRYYALLLCTDGGRRTIRLVKALDGETVLAETDLAWAFDAPYHLALEAEGSRLRAFLDGALLFDLEDTNRPLAGGAVALVCEEGMMTCEAVEVGPFEPSEVRSTTPSPQGNA